MAQNTAVVEDELNGIPTKHQRDLEVSDLSIMN
jgi:hypothetical protein